MHLNTCNVWSVTSFLPMKDYYCQSQLLHLCMFGHISHQTNVHNSLAGFNVEVGNEVHLN